MGWTNAPGYVDLSRTRQFRCEIVAPGVHHRLVEMLLDEAWEQRQRYQRNGYTWTEVAGSARRS